MRPPRASLIGLCAASALLAGPRGAVAAGPALRCPAPDELAGIARAAGAGGDNQRRVYAVFGERYGRPADLTQDGASSEIAYGPGRGTIRFSLRRDPATGALAISCR